MKLKLMTTFLILFQQIAWGSDQFGAINWNMHVGPSSSVLTNSINNQNAVAHPGTENATKSLAEADSLIQGDLDAIRNGTAVSNFKVRLDNKDYANVELSFLSFLVYSGTIMASAGIGNYLEGLETIGWLVPYVSGALTASTVANAVSSLETLFLIEASRFGQQSQVDWRELYTTAIVDATMPNIRPGIPRASVRTVARRYLENIWRTTVPWAHTQLRVKHQQRFSKALLSKSQNNATIEYELDPRIFLTYDFKVGDANFAAIYYALVATSGGLGAAISPENFMAKYRLQRQIPLLNRSAVQRPYAFRLKYRSSGINQSVLTRIESVGEVPIRAPMAGMDIGDFPVLILMEPVWGHWSIMMRHWIDQVRLETYDKLFRIADLDNFSIRSVVRMSNDIMHNRRTFLSNNPRDGECYFFDANPYCPQNSWQLQLQNFISLPGYPGHFAHEYNIGVTYPEAVGPMVNSAISPPMVPMQFTKSTKDYASEEDVRAMDLRLRKMASTVSTDATDIGFEHTLHIDGMDPISIKVEDITYGSPIVTPIIDPQNGKTSYRVQSGGFLQLNIGTASQRIYEGQLLFQFDGQNEARLFKYKNNQDHRKKDASYTDGLNPILGVLPYLQLLNAPGNNFGPLQVRTVEKVLTWLLRPSYLQFFKAAIGTTNLKLNKGNPGNYLSLMTEARRLTNKRWFPGRSGPAALGFQHFSAREFTDLNLSENYIVPDKFTSRLINSTRPLKSDVSDYQDRVENVYAVVDYVRDPVSGRKVTKCSLSKTHSNAQGQVRTITSNWIMARMRSNSNTNSVRVNTSEYYDFDHHGSLHFAFFDDLQEFTKAQMGELDEPYIPQECQVQNPALFSLHFLSDESGRERVTTTRADYSFLVMGVNEQRDQQRACLPYLKFYLDANANSLDVDPGYIGQYRYTIAKQKNRVTETPCSPVTIDVMSFSDPSVTSGNGGGRPSSGKGFSSKRSE